MSSEPQSLFHDAVVLGARGAFGSILLEKLLALGHRGVGFDKAGGGEDAVSEDVFALSPSAQEQIARADVVVLALPDEVTISVGPKLATQLPQSSLLVDCTSTKAHYARAVNGAGPCSKISINPLFGPSLDWNGRPMAVSVLSAGQGTHAWFRFLREVGVDIIDVDADAHDRLAAEAQAAVHASLLAFLLSVGEESSRFATPPNQLMRLLSARLLSGEPHIYWGIQKFNPFAHEARRRLVLSLETLNQIIDNDDADAFTKLWESGRRKFGQNLPLLEKRCRRVFEYLNELENAIE